MKQSRRNVRNSVTTAEKRVGGKPKVSRFALKHGVLPETPKKAEGGLTNK